ncbi:MAG TPA: hypothetical protein VKD90_13500 [Gemmataceae bacterium]|nr:hypothetical protein [Gemmataceae bacterium]
MMKDQQFTVSPSAAAYIQEMLQIGARHPKFAGLVPGLGFYYEKTAWTEDMLFVRHVPDGHFLVCFFDTHQASDFDRYCVAGADLAISPESLDRLRGTNLELEEVPKKGRMSRWLVARKY